MWRELFTGSPATAFAVAALLFFVAMFGGVVAWVLNGRRAEHYRRMARLPVDNDAEETRP